MSQFDPLEIKTYDLRGNGGIGWIPKITVSIWQDTPEGWALGQFNPETLRQDNKQREPIERRHYVLASKLIQCLDVMQHRFREGVNQGRYYA